MNILPVIVALVSRAWRFVRARAVLAVSFVAAAVTVAFVPPDAEYAGYVDVRTIVCLFCILAVVGALRSVGAFERAACAVIARFRAPRRAVGALVFATAALSMVATNDMALIVMLPLAAATLVRAGWPRLLPVTFVQQSLAANLGGMIVPFGNPQNLYLYAYYAINIGEFLATMALPFAVSMALVALSCAAFVRQPRSAGAPEDAEAGAPASAGASASASAPAAPAAAVSASAPVDPALAPLNRKRVAAYVALFVLTVGSVLRVVPPAVSLAAVVAVLAVLDRRALMRVDYALLLTFVCFFVFAGNMARIPAVDAALGELMRTAPLLASAGLSQVISNVPAAVLLSHFTDAWQPLLVGVNIGGAGMLVGSLASLIMLQSFQTVRRMPSLRGERALSTGRFLAVFSAFNFAFLIVLCAVCAMALPQ